MKKFSKWILNTILIAGSLVMLSTGMKVSAASVISSGPCGADGASVNYTLTDDGVLTIEGTGAIKNYSDVGAQTPWKSYLSDITTVIIGDGVTTICASAFNGYNNLTSVTIADSVSIIRGSAFQNCTNLTSITLPSGLTQIYSSAFYGTGLESITIPAGVTKLGWYSFKESNYLKTVIIENADILSNGTIDENAFVNTPVETLEIRNWTTSDTDKIEALLKKVLKTYGELADIPSTVTIKVPEDRVSFVQSKCTSANVSYPGAPDSSSDSGSSNKSSSKSSSKSSRKKDEPAPPPTSRVEADALLQELTSDIAAVEDDTDSINIVSKYYNSFSKEFMSKLQNEKLTGKTIFLEYDYEGKHFVTSIPGGPSVSADLDWYGPAKLASMYPTTFSVLKK